MYINFHKIEINLKTIHTCIFMYVLTDSCCKYKTYTFFTAKFNETVS